MTTPRKTRFPGIEAMSDGRKLIRVRAVDRRTGRMKEVRRVREATVEEALKLQRDWKGEIADADRKAEAVPRFGDYAELWMRSKAPALKPSTAATYADILDVHVLPRFGEFFLDKITVQDVRRWQTDLAGEMAAATVKNCLRMLKMVLADAVVDFELPRSPAERIRNFPMRRRLDEEANSLEADELGKVLACFRESEPEHYPLALTLALTGIRYGEATALKWSDVDEQDGLIRVARAQWKGHVSTTKTGVIRTVPLVPELAAALREQRNRQLAEQSAGLVEGWIFTKSDGRLLPKSALRWPLIRVLERVGIKRRFTRHGFRFTFNNLSRRVAGEIVTRSITGHVTQAMTEHYSHVGREEKVRAAGSIVQLVTGKGTPTSSG